jgi:uncharacterized protein YggE
MWRNRMNGKTAKGSMMRKTVGILVSTVLMTALIVTGLNFSSVFAQAPEQAVDDGAIRRSISVSGAGSASAAPDMAVVVVGVRTEAEDAATALTENNQSMGDLIDALREAGIAQADLQTQQINLSPRYANQPNQTGQPQVTGYEAMNTLQVRVRDMDQVGEILDNAVQSGGNIIHSIRFETADAQDVLQQAREAAFNDARQKAEQLASLADVQLGSVITINETTSSLPRPFAVAAQTEAADRAVPVEPGLQDVDVTLQVTWEITP